MGTLSQALATPAEFEHQGKVYRVSPVTLEVQALYERYLERQVLDACARCSQDLPPQAYERALARVMGDVGIGTYSWGTPACAQSCDLPSGNRYLLFLCLKRNHPELSLEDVEGMARDKRLNARMQQALWTANADPDGEDVKKKGEPRAEATNSAA